MKFPICSVQLETKLLETFVKMKWLHIRHLAEKREENRKTTGNLLFTVTLYILLHYKYTVTLHYLRFRWKKLKHLTFERGEIEKILKCSAVSIAVSVTRSRSLVFTYFPCRSDCLCFFKVKSSAMSCSAVTTMLTRRLLCRKQLWQASYYRAAVRYTQSAASQLLDGTNLELRLPERTEKKPQRKPFAKNLCLGSFDYEFMYYPEPQSKARHDAFFDWLKPIESYMAECLADPTNIRRDEVLAHLKDLGVFRAHVDEVYHGLNLMHTELAKLLEVLSVLPWLGSYFVKNHVLPIQLINMLASDEQKTKYLPRIVTGEVVPTVCLTEANDGLNVGNIETIVDLLDDSMYWLLNGKKSFVANACDANLFLVFAHCGIVRTSDSMSKALSVFLVDGDSKGITLQNVNTLVGDQGSSVCTVGFQNVQVPKLNLLGEIGSSMNMLIDYMAPGNRYIAPQAVGYLKHFIKLLTTHVLQRKHLDQNMHEYEGVQEVIIKMKI